MCCAPFFRHLCFVERPRLLSTSNWSQTERGCSLFDWVIFFFFFLTGRKEQTCRSTENQWVGGERNYGQLPGFVPHIQGKNAVTTSSLSRNVPALADQRWRVVPVTFPGVNRFVQSSKEEARRTGCHSDWREFCQYLVFVHRELSPLISLLQVPCALYSIGDAGSQRSTTRISWKGHRRKDRR